MNAVIRVVLVLLLAGPFGVYAESKAGVGFVLGDPTALSGKWYRSDERAMDLQFAFFRNGYFLIYGDYLHHFPGIFGGREKFIRQLSPYVGVGPFIAIATDDDRRRRGGDYFDDDEDNDFAIGARVPFGIEWLWDRVPLGIGIEIAPGIVVAPSTEGVVQAGLTLRYYF